MKRIYFVIISLVILIILIVTSSSFSRELPKIAVMGITSIASGYTWRSDSPLSEGATDLMINALLNTNRFRVFKRFKLDAILLKLNFQYFSALIDRTTAVKLGKMIGADIIITGNINNIIFDFPMVIPFPLPPPKECKVSMNIRIIDVTNGDILFSTVQEEKASKSAVSGLLPIPIPDGIGFSHQEAVDILSAVQLICDKVALDFSTKIDQKNIAVNSAPLEGYVVKVVSTSSGGIVQVYINLGASSGIRVGEEIRIYREGEVILDPKTNEVLDRELDILAQARIKTVKDKLSIAMVTTKFRNTPIQQSDIVEVLR